MNLVEALREIGPARGEAAAVRQRAAELIHGELRHFVEHTWLRIDPDDREEAAARVIVRLIHNGPRGERAGDPTTPGGVRAFLRKSFGNSIRDLLRRQKRWIDMGDEFDVADLRRGPSEEASQREQTALVRAAERALFERVLPEVAASSKIGRALLDSFEQLRAVRDGKTTVAELVKQECAADAHPHAEKKARNRLDQRFSRAFTRLNREIETRLSDGRLDEDEASRTRRILDGLRLRQ
jgi:hypothetical protein